MPMSPVDINNAVQYFAGKNTARLASVTANGNAPLIQRAISQPSTTSGGSTSGGSTSGGNNSGTGNGAPSAQDQAMTPGRNKIISDWRGPDGMPNPLGWLLTAGHDGKGGTSIIDDALQSQGDTQRPQNLVQNVMNFMGIGAYTTGEILHKMGENVAAGPAAMDKSLASQDLGTQILRRLGSDYFGAAGKGIAEGFGARPDGQRPNTPGSDAQQIGLTGAVDKATSDLVKGAQGFFNNTIQATTGKNNPALKPGDPAAQTNTADQFGHFMGGITGFGADVALDPLTYLTAGGTGLVKGASKAAKAAGDAARAGDNALIAGLKGVKAGATSVAGHPIDLMEGRALIQAQKAARASGDTSVINMTDQAARDAARFAVPPEAAVAADAAQTSARVAPDIIHAPAETALAPEAAATHDVINTLPDATVQKLLTPDNAPAVGKLGTSAADLATREAAVKELLPTITGRLGEPVDAGSILSNAAATAKSLITDKTATAARSILHDSSTVAEANAGISALKKTADGQRLLTQTVTVNGTTRTVGDALSAAATRRLTGGTGAGAVGANANADLFTAVGGAIDKAASTVGKTTPGSLEAAITGAGFGAPPDMAALFSRLAQTPPGAAREQIIKDTLASSTGYKNFDDAIKASVHGQVEASVMRSMLKALGIDTRATKSSTLSTMLGKQGAMNWDEIQQGIPTAQEVLDNHGIPASVNEAAAQVDPDTNAAQAAQQFEDVTASIPNVLDPATAKLPTTAGKTAEAIQNGIAAYSRLDFTGPVAEKYMKEAWLTVHRSIINTLKITPNTMELGGLSRADWLFARYMHATEAVETHARSLGVTPYLPGIPGDTSGALYASAGQIMHALPEDLVKQILLAPVRTDEATATAGKLGITIYPTTIGEGVKAAIDGQPPLVRMLQSDRVNAFQRTVEGRTLLNQIATAITEPNFLAKITDLHQAGRMAAVAQATKDAGAVVAPAADKILKAIDANGDRGAVITAANEMQKAVKDMAPAGQVSLTRDMASQRADQGLTTELGQVGVAQMRADARSAAAKGSKTPAQALADQQRVAARFGTRKTADGVAIAPTAGGHSPADNVLLGETAKNNAAFAADNENLINDAAHQLAVDAGIDPSAAMITAEMTSPIARLFGKTNELFNGAAGMADIKVLQEAASGGALQYSHAYTRTLSSWLYGSSTPRPGLFTKNYSTPGLGQRLQEAMGLDHIATDSERDQFLVKWWSAISAHEKGILTETGKLPTAEELAASLQTGRPTIGATDVGGAPALSAAEIPLAMEWHALIQTVFHPTDGPLQRIGVPLSDIIKQQEKFGFAQGDAHSGFGASDTGTAADMSLIPHGFDYGLMQHPADILANWHTSLSSSSVAPAIGASFARIHGNMAAEMSAADAKAAGWVTLKRDGANAGFAAYTPEGVYYPKEIAQQAMFMNRFLDNSSKSLPEFFKLINRVYDPITGALKSSLTQLNPRHHVTNNLGNLGQMALNQIHPGYAIKGVHILRDMGELQGADMTPLDALFNSKVIGSDINANTALKPSFNTGQTEVLMKTPGGGFHKVSLSSQQVGTEAGRGGSTIGAHQALDMTAEGGHTLDRGRYARFINSPKNLPERGIRQLGDFSAKYDNVARLAHFTGTLERGSYRSLDEAFAAAHAAVHKFNPTTASLSPFEQRYARRAIFFYQWQRRALEMVASVALERPAIITAPSKFQYDQANANGLEPESYGKPTGPDKRIPSYESNGLYGPSFHAGADQWGISLSTPQLDASQSFLGGVNDFSGHNPDGPVFGFLRSNLSQLNPLLKAGPELLLNKNISGIGKGPDADIPGYLASQTGLPFSLATIAGLTPSTNKKLNTPQENKDAQVRALANWITGLKFTNYTNPTATAVAKKERGLDDTQKLTDMGYSPIQIKTIKQIWKTGH